MPQIHRVLSMLATSGEDLWTCEGGLFDLLSICARYLDFECQEPVDHIYAVLGLIDPYLKFLADYSETPSDTLRRLLALMADQKVSFSIEAFLAVAEAVTEESRDPLRGPNSRGFYLNNQLCYVRFSVESCLKFSLANDCRHTSIEPWTIRLGPGEKSKRFRFWRSDGTNIKCRCHGLWPAELGVTNPTAKPSYTRTAFRISDPEPLLRSRFRHRRGLLILIATPSEMHQGLAPLSPSAFVVRDEKPFDTTQERCLETTACELSGPLQEDMLAFHLAHFVRKPEAELGITEARDGHFDVPLRAESLSQLCDIYREFEVTSADSLKG